MMTDIGVLLGTAAYMSPEQAAGRQVDKRSDLWAFGVVLLEMLTGRPVFTGETVSHVLASVLKSDPDWSGLPTETPVPIRRLLRRCLEKERKRRLDSASVARLEIEDALVPRDSGVSAIAAAPFRRRLVAVAIGAAMVSAALGALATWAIVRPAPANPRLPSRFVIRPPAALAPWMGSFLRSIALSPDGRHLVYTAAPGAGPGGALLVRSIDQLELTPLSGITRARAPFFSPDGQWVGFFQDTELRKAPITGGPAISICSVRGAPRGASWGDDGMIVFATGDPTTGLWRVPSGGGGPTLLTSPAQGEGDHIFPVVLPAGRGVLYTTAAPGQAGNSDIAVLDARTNQRRTLIHGGSQPDYVETGHLVYAAAGTLRAIRFDLATLQVLGDPLPVLEHVGMAQTGAADYAVSRSGTLAYLPNAQPVRSLIWVDRAGHEEPLKLPLRAYALPRVSPDSAHVALDIRDQENDIWILDLGRDASLRKLTYGRSIETNPVWTADGKHLIFTSNRSGPPRLYRQAVDGTGSAEPLTTGENAQFATSVTPDGTGIVGHQDGPTMFDIVFFPLPNSVRESTPGLAPVAAAVDHVREVVKTPLFEHGAELSPNGRYLAYQSNESGQYEVIVRPFPQVDRGMWTVSTGGGSRPVWARNGRELFYRDGPGALIVVPVDTTGSTFVWGSPLKLFDSRDVASGPDRNYDVAPDGKRFLMIKAGASTGADEIVVVLDWSQELKRLVRTN
jgi:Tol biopolymer transport system component